MSILDTNKIDIVATRPDSNIVKLVIADHLDWADMESHGRLLQDKINTYLAFVESGQMKQLSTPPIPETPQVVITLAVQRTLTPDAESLLARVRSFLEGLGIGFTWEIRSVADPNQGVDPV